MTRPLRRIGGRQCAPIWPDPLTPELGADAAPPIIAGPLLAVTGATGGFRVYAVPA